MALVLSVLTVGRRKPMARFARPPSVDVLGLAASWAERGEKPTRKLGKRKRKEKGDLGWAGRGEKREREGVAGAKWGLRPFSRKKTFLFSLNSFKIQFFEQTTNSNDF